MQFGQRKYCGSERVALNIIQSCDYLYILYFVDRIGEITKGYFADFHGKTLSLFSVDPDCWTVLLGLTMTIMTCLSLSAVNFQNSVRLVARGTSLVTNYLKRRWRNRL